MVDNTTQEKYTFCVIQSVEHLKNWKMAKSIAWDSPFKTLQVNLMVDNTTLEARILTNDLNNVRERQSL